MTIEELTAQLESVVSKITDMKVERASFVDMTRNIHALYGEKIRLESEIIKLKPATAEGGIK
jgi:hypothetical protein